ncbi:MAG: DnaD domain protein [bacterium]
MYKSNKRFVVDALFIKNAAEYKLTLNEFILLMYFDNGIETVVNIKNISSNTKLKESDIMLALSSLIEKKLVEIIIEKNNSGKITEVISLDGFYLKMRENAVVTKKNDLKNDTFKKFEKSFKRVLSANEIEVIKVWLNNLYTEDLILTALKESEYNGVANIRYIDKILYEWNKKGYKVSSDIVKKQKKSQKSVEVNPSILDYNWLDNE